MVFALLGLPSLQSIVQAIAKDFFGALAGALVPGWLRHGTVATIQHLVALPDPASWSHVNQLQDDTIYLAASLMPVVLAVATLRYWTVGLTGAAHPASALARTAGAAGVLVAYPWIVTQTVAATNTLTHAILGFPAVSEGLGRLIGILFDGALLTGAGGVFGALLVIIGVLVAAGLFALQVLLTVLLALLIVAGPPLIVLSAVPELSHLARAWASTLLSITLIPLGWTLLFATAGALSLDASSLTGGAGGLPEHVSAAFAGLATFVIAVKLPLMLLGEIRHKLTATSLSAQGGQSAGPGTPGSERIARAHARLRAVALAGAPALGASVGAAAGALGAPAGGPLGAVTRRLGGLARRAGMPVRPAAATERRRTATAGGQDKQRSSSQARNGARARVARAGRTLAKAPREARDAVRDAERRERRVPARPVSTERQADGQRSSQRHSSSARAAQGAAEQRSASRVTEATATRSAQAAASSGATDTPSRSEKPPTPRPAARASVPASKRAPSAAHHSPPAPSSSPPSQPQRPSTQPAASPGPQEMRRQLQRQARSQRSGDTRPQAPGQAAKRTTEQAGGGRSAKPRPAIRRKRRPRSGP